MATAVDEDVHVEVAVKSCVLPSLYVPIALYCWLFPMSIVKPDGVTVIDWSDGAAVVTMKFTPLLANPPTVTTTLPDVAPLGTGATIDVSLQPVDVAVVPLNLTVLAPWLAPKLVPEIVTDVPTGPEFGDKLLMYGVTENATPLLETPLTVTTTAPVLAPFGTGTAMDVSLQVEGVAPVPLKVTVPVA